MVDLPAFPFLQVPNLVTMVKIQPHSVKRLRVAAVVLQMEVLPSQTENLAGQGVGEVVGVGMLLLLEEVEPLGRVFGVETGAPCFRVVMSV